MNMVTDFKAYVNSYDFKAYVDSYENTNTSTQLNAQSEDQEINNLTKQGYDGCTQHFKNVWDSSQGQIFVTDTVNPQVDIQPTWKCEILVRDVDLQKPGSNKDSEGKPKIPEHITCQAACAYDIYGKCTGMLFLERLNILLLAYNQFKRIGLHSTTQPPVQDAAIEIVRRSATKV